jgi:1-acyl-sn-glycerol-3-phosphate acyltransferase
VTDLRPLAFIVAFVRTVTAYLVVSLFVVVAGSLGILLALVFRAKIFLFAPAHAGVALALAMAGIRTRVAGREHIPVGGAIFCSNHQSNIDPPMLFHVLRLQLRMIYKIEFDRVPILSYALRLADFVPIDRRDRGHASRAIQRAASYVGRGLPFLVFAEGTRSRAGELLPFKKGGFIMALLAQKPIVPIAITGGRDAMVKGSAVIHPVRVSVRIGTPIDTRGLSVSDRDRLMTDVRAAIEGLLAEGPVLH